MAESMAVNPFLETMVRQTQNDPCAIEADNREQARFFWGVKNVQITHFKDSHNEFTDWGDVIEVKTVTETTQYATITYERDTRIPHYAEVVAVEERYRAAKSRVHSLEEQRYDLKGKAIDKDNLISAGTLIVAIKYVVLFIIALCFVKLSQFAGGPAVVGIFWFVLIIALGARNLIRNQKDFEKTKKELYSEAWPELRQVNQEADELYERVAQEL